MATLNDVAQRAGVTVTTVSRVLNNRGYISEKTRSNVYKAMEEIGYQPNELARALLTGKSNLIGLIIQSIAHPFFAELTEYIEYYANLNGYKILLCNSYQEHAKEKDYIEMLRGHQVDGIIMGSHNLETSEYVNLKLPIVTFDRYLSDSIPCVTSDNYAGGAMATRLLIEKGCKKIAHISGSLTLNTPANKRLNSFVDVANEYGVPYVLLETKLNSFDKTEYESVVRELLSKHPDVDGVFASSDIIAACIIELAGEFGRQVPGDLKIVGYDDIALASLIVPGITTISQPKQKLGELAIDVLIRQMKGEEVPAENILPVELIERKTT